MLPTAPASVSVSVPAERPARLVCSEVWGGNRRIHVPFDLPGIRGVLFSQPCKGGRGGDVHYLSVCGSGILARLCVADVAGHGESVATLSGELHAILRRLMNWPDERRIFRRLNRRLHEIGLDAMTTAAAVSYYPPSRKISVSYAGHPPAWFYRRADDRWEVLHASRDERPGRFVDGPLAIDPNATYSRMSIKVELGDRLVLVTDGVLEAPNAARERFGTKRVEQVLHDHRNDAIATLGEAMLTALADHAGGAGFSHDDVTYVVAEFVPGPTYATHLWLALKNRIFPEASFLPESIPA
jgi:sigma-B regulation protein RsbU (phosphoserine phosphatase)